MSIAPSMTYSVGYATLDAFKRAAMKAALTTSHLLPPGFEVLEWSRGESCFLLKTPWGIIIAIVIEGLGTKDKVADAMYQLVLADEIERRTGHDLHFGIGIDVAAAIINDMATSGAQPLVLAMHLAVGDEKIWFANTRRQASLVAGWQQACLLAKCAWGPGETPTLRDVIMPDSAVISGSATGFVLSESRVIKPRIQDGDAIVLVGSDGIAANGLTMAREIAAKLPAGYLTEVEKGLTYGEALLQPTLIYSSLVQTCLDQGIDVHYAVNITGHGWRKLMRSLDSFVYVMNNPGQPPAVFPFMQQHGPVSNREAYQTFNMGANFALMVHPDDVEPVREIAHSERKRAWRGGTVHKQGNQKKVVIQLPEEELVYEAETLAVR